MAMDVLTGLGYGIITFAILIGVGLTVLAKFGDAVGAGEANEGIDYMSEQLGEGGLAGWTPAIIAIIIGLFFLGLFLTKKGRSV